MTYKPSDAFCRGIWPAPGHNKFSFDQKLPGSKKMKLAKALTKIRDAHVPKSWGWHLL